MTKKEFEWAIENAREQLEDTKKDSSYWWYIYGGLITLEVYYENCYKTAKKSYLKELLSES